MKGFYHGLVDDFDGRIRLSVDPVDPFQPQADRTIALWEQYGQTAAENWDLDDEGRKAVDAVIQRNGDHLQALIETDRTRINSWLRGESRLEGFARDEQLSSAAANEVASLAGQVGTIASERRAESQGWFSTIEAMWDDVESSVNDIGRRHDKNAIPLPLSRPYAEKWSPNALINLALPWFDLGVGALLVVGLFTRFAAFSGAVLLLGVVGSQPFWLPTAQPTWSQWIELAALLVVAFSPAGRFGGLDYFFRKAAPTGNSEQQ